MIIEILKYTLPALIVFITAYLLIIKFVNNEREQRKLELLINNQKTVIPIKLQAYERLVLFLERVSPQSLVIRSQRPGMTNIELQNSLLKTIRLEFEHNMTQQLYVSNKSWQMVINAKENLVKTVNQNALRVKPDAPAIQLSKLILENVIDTDKDPINKAIQQLKSEISTILP